VLTSKKLLTKKKCSVRVFSMIEFRVIQCVRMDSHNAINELELFSHYGNGTDLRSYFLRGE
jgi:hypothetical protein